MIEYRTSSTKDDIARGIVSSSVRCTWCGCCVIAHFQQFLTPSGGLFLFLGGEGERRTGLFGSLKKKMEGGVGGLLIN